MGAAVAAWEGAWGSCDGAAHAAAVLRLGSGGAAHRAARWPGRSGGGGAAASGGGASGGATSDRGGALALAPPAPPAG